MVDALIAHIHKLIARKDFDLNPIDSYFSAQHLRKKQFLQSEGQRCKYNCFVKKGCLRMYFVTDKGTEQTVQFALENWWISDYFAFEQQRTTQFYIQAIESTDVLLIDLAAQERMITEVPIMERYFRLLYQRAYGASQVRMKYLTDFSKEESYQHFSASFPEFVRRIPQQILASYLQMTPEYLSEIKRKIKEQ